MPSTEPEAALDALVASSRAGDPTAAGRLFELLYETLHGCAGRAMRSQSPGHTLQPTALLHEAYLRLRPPEGGWADAGHFALYVVRTMRSVLVDHARRRRAAKRRRGGASPTPAFGLLVDFERAAIDVLELDRALTALAAQDSLSAQVVELRYFGGLPWDAVAAASGVSVRTAQRRWGFAQVWLRARLS